MLYPIHPHYLLYMYILILIILIIIHLLLQNHSSRILNRNHLFRPHPLNFIHFFIITIILPLTNSISIIIYSIYLVLCHFRNYILHNYFLFLILLKNHFEPFVLCVLYEIHLHLNHHHFYYT